MKKVEYNTKWGTCRFDAFYKDDSKNNHITDESGNVITEMRFHIIAESDHRAMDLIEQEGYNPFDFYIELIGEAKNEMGKYLPESIMDARL